MQDFGWLEGIFGSVHCAHCGAPYSRGDVIVVGNRDEYWFLRCVCSTCQTQGVGVVVVKDLVLAAPSASLVEEAMVGTRCANCGAGYFRSDLLMVGSRDEYWFLRSQCHVDTCGKQSVLVAIIHSPIESPDTSAPSLTADDVLTAHEILREYAGDVHGLFARKKQ